MLKDVAGTGGLKVLSMYVRTFGLSTVVEMKTPNRHVRNSVSSKMLNIHGLAYIILQCDPEPSFIK